MQWSNVLVGTAESESVFNQNAMNPCMVESVSESESESESESVCMVGLAADSVACRTGSA